MITIVKRRTELDFRRKHIVSVSSSLYSYETINAPLFRTPTLGTLKLNTCPARLLDHLLQLKNNGFALYYYEHTRCMVSPSAVQVSTYSDSYCS